MSISEKATKTNRGGSRANAGRKSREELGLEPLVAFSSKVERSVIEQCQLKFGSVANALRYASKSEI